MSTRLRRGVGAGVLTLAGVAAFPATLRASDILLPDFEMFDPLPGTQIYLENKGTGDIFGLVPFVGVPLGEFDFGSGPAVDPLCPPPATAPPMGPVRTGNTDTIIRRDECIRPDDLSANIELVAMQLVSDGEFDLGAGLDLYFLTLQTGVASTGTMVYQEFGPNDGPPPPAHGSFRYESLFWNFDLWKGRLPQPGDTPVFSDSKVLSSDFVHWSHFGLSDAVRIPGVNFLLDGTPFADSFAVTPFSLFGPDGTRILMGPATVPEPAVMTLVGTVAAALAVRARRRRRCAGR